MLKRRERYIDKAVIVPFKVLKNCKRRNKGNFTLKFNSNKIMLCGGVGQFQDFKVFLQLIVNLTIFFTKRL